MPEVIRERRRQLLRILLRNKPGATVDELAHALGVTRTAVRQHLASSMHQGLVARGAERASGGRPGQLYVLTDAGREEFPRHYSWFAQLLIEAIAQEHGATGLRTRLGASRPRSWTSCASARRRPERGARKSRSYRR